MSSCRSRARRQIAPRRSRRDRASRRHERRKGTVIRAACRPYEKALTRAVGWRACGVSPKLTSIKRASGVSMTIRESLTVRKYRAPSVKQIPLLIAKDFKSAGIDRAQSRPTLRVTLDCRRQRLCLEQMEPVKKVGYPSRRRIIRGLNAYQTPCDTVITN